MGRVMSALPPHHVGRPSLSGVTYTLAAVFYHDAVVHS